MITARHIIRLLEDNGYDVVPSDVQSDGSTDTLSGLLQNTNGRTFNDSSGSYNRNSMIIGAAIQNIVDNLGKDISLELSELIEDALQSVDPNGDLSVEEAVSKLRSDDAQKLYYDIQSYLNKSNTSMNTQDNSNGIAQTSSGVLAQQPNDVQQQSQGSTEQ
jgi:hypothetical protein